MTKLCINMWQYTSWEQPYFATSVSNIGVWQEAHSQRITENQVISSRTIREVSQAPQRWQAQRYRSALSKRDVQGSNKLKSESWVIGQHQLPLLQRQCCYSTYCHCPTNGQLLHSLYRNMVLLIMFCTELVITRLLLFLSNFFTFLFMWCL